MLDMTATDLPALVSILSEGRTIDREAAAHSLSKRVKNNVAQRKAAAAAGSIPPLLSLLSSPNDAVAAAGADAIRWMAGDCNNEALGAAGVVPRLIDMYQSTAPDQSRARALSGPFVAALRNLTIESDQNIDGVVDNGGLVHVVALLGVDDADTVGDASAILRNATGHSDPARAGDISGIVCALGALTPLVDVLANANELVQQQAAGAVWNLSNHHGDAVLAAGAVAPLIALLGLGSSGAYQTTTGSSHSSNGRLRGGGRNMSRGRGGGGTGVSAGRGQRRGRTVQRLPETAETAAGALNALLRWMVEEEDIGGLCTVLDTFEEAPIGFATLYETIQEAARLRLQRARDCAASFGVLVDRKDRSAAFQALSAAIDAVQPKITDGKYKQLCDAAKLCFDS